jgi:hypothetical protein
MQSGRTWLMCGFPMALRAGALEHDPEKWKPVFGQDHAQNEQSRRGTPKRTLETQTLQREST